MMQWAELATLMMLGLATLMVAWNVYLSRVTSNLVCRLASDAVHLKLLITLAANELYNHGIAVIEHEPQSAKQKAKMN